MPDPPAELGQAVSSVLAGRWAVGVSGGADSVALLSLMRRRSDLTLHVVHLDHQTRGHASTADAAFVELLSGQWGLPCTIETRAAMEACAQGLPRNTSARFRRLRLIVFERVVRDQALEGVVLAHHADDQAETVLHRLIRCSGPSGLAAMAPRTLIGDLIILRPLLGVRREQLRDYLNQISQPWRTDVSNESPAYLRSRLRETLARHPQLVDSLLRLGEDCRRLTEWARSTAPRLDARFAAARLADLPEALARESARAWLAERGVPRGEIEPAVIHRLLEMARDAASPAQRLFPARVSVRRSRGEIFSE